MSSRLKQTTIDVGNFAALMSPRPAGGRGSVAPVSAAPPGRHTGTLAGRQKRKKPIRQDGLFTCLMPGSLWRASCPPPSGPLLRNVQIRSRRICPPQESAHRQTTDKTKKPGLSTGLSALFDAWQFPTLTWGDPTLPSALRRFTSEFGMGSGGTTALVPPGKFCFINTSHQRID